MSKVAVQYAIVRFAPFVETGEFANIGVVACAPELGAFGYKLERKRYKRINDFFPKAPKELLKRALRSLDEEFAHFSKYGNSDLQQQHFRFSNRDEAIHGFQYVTRPREGLINFSHVRVRMADDFFAVIDQLFEFYVQHGFADKQYGEALLEQQTKLLLETEQLADRFREVKFSDGIYPAQFKFVEPDKKLIKPLFLKQEKPQQIIDHGEKWIRVYDRLKAQLPPDVMYVLERPSTDDAKWKAYREIHDALKKHDIQIALASDKQKILDFARA